MESKRNQKEAFNKMNTDKIPVILLTGYLGAGKTTVMNHLLSQNFDKKIALIVNDMGSVNIDARLLNNKDLQMTDTTMVELTNGCICCTLRDEFMQQIEQLALQDEIDCILVEASGISNPASIAEAFLSYQQTVVKELFYLSSIVTVVDADRMLQEFILQLENEQEKTEDIEQEEEDDLDILNLIMDQIEFCNVILLNKCDLLSKEDIKRIEDVLRQLQSKASIYEMVEGKIDSDIILSKGMFDYDEVNLSSAIQSALAREDKREEKQTDFGVTSFVYEEKRPFSYEKFMDFLENHYPKEIIRAKGYLWYGMDENHIQLFEQAGRNVSVTEMSNWVASFDEKEQQEVFLDYPEVLETWDETYGDRLNQIVFIGQNYNKEEIVSMLNACLED